METSAELRSAFLNYFKQNDHEIVPSGPLVPANDPTLLFTNAGMVQFKDVFLGKESLNYTRATSSQRCVRVGGKHNDLDNVGYTARHHTFFEMLGNFSFGDYFKREAIHYAWEFLTKVVQLPEECLWVTVYEEDEEAADIWLKDINVNSQRFLRIGAKDNFWAMGDTGPCGPCTEIFYDHGEKVQGGPPGTPEQEGDRYVEVWNLVFMQYERDKQGTLNVLPKPSVDTGMGLERLAAILQGVTNNYDTDLFVKIIKTTADIAKVTDTSAASLRVIADHIRSCSFLIAEGVVPSNEGRGYVLRRIIRRAVRHGNKLGIQEPFFHKLVQPLIESMGQAYPDLMDASERVQKTLENEEHRFSETLNQGMRILQEDIDKLSGNTISGETVFKLYDTYGFPVDLTADIARERQLNIDEPGFNKYMEAQRERGRQASRFDIAYDASLAVQTRSEFTGYEHMQDQAVVQELFVNNKSVKTITEGESGVIVLSQTPFYGESGGQVGDQGVLKNDVAMFEVADTKKLGDVNVHLGKLTSGSLAVNDRVVAQVDEKQRRAIVLNHSATHLMHAALRQVLGEHVQQKGSLVAPDRLRFDFSNDVPVSEQELERIETIVNNQIRENSAATAKTMSKDKALAAGAMALFGEKYGDEVRVLSIGEFSVELCGGVHVQRAGDIGLFKIVSESGIASGVRRIEAVTGDAALQWITETENQLSNIASLVKASKSAAKDKIAQLLERNRVLEKECNQLKSKLASQAGSDLSKDAIEIDGLKVIAHKIDGADPKSLRDTLDQLKNKLGSAAIVLATSNGSKVSLIAGVTKDQTKRIKAGDLVNAVAIQVGGKGGGRPDMAQAGGNNPAALDAALQSVPDWVRANLR
ncbi:MAG: alanine--tRNA ligase [Gammaproteobacteria bacterium]|nr:alanine--tRNA ligase [Gammaproteobacteria bacterium]